MSELANKKVLVTGADGFIGSLLCERLVGEAAEVRAFCMYNSQGSWGWLDRAPTEIQEALDVRLGDIRDSGFVAAACEGVDVVCHLAALIAIPYSYTAPQSFIDTNIFGTLNVLEAARRHDVGRVVQTSTSEVYGTPDVLPIREDHPLKAQSPYAATKVAADQLALSYYRSFEVPVVVLRPFNTYGPRQSARAFLPTILTQLLAGQSEILLGRTDPRRDLTYVGDTVDGFVRACTRDGIEGDTVQLGTGRAVSIKEVFDLACNVTGQQAEIRQDPRRIRPSASEVEVLQADASLARTKLGWEAEISLEDGLRKTADWLRDNLARYRVDYLHL